MRTTLLCSLFFFFFSYSGVNSNSVSIAQHSIGETPELSPVCQGSVTLHNDVSEDRVVNEDMDIRPRMRVTRVLVEGCGCFTLHSRTRGRGRSLFLSGNGERNVNMRVGSVGKVSCDTYAWKIQLWSDHNFQFCNKIISFVSSIKFNFLSCDITSLSPEVFKILNLFPHSLISYHLSHILHILSHIFIMFL